MFWKQELFLPVTGEAPSCSVACAGIPLLTPVSDATGRGLPGTTFHSHTGMYRSPHVPGTEFLKHAHAWDSASNFVERKIREFLIRSCKKMRQTVAIRCRTKLDECTKWHYFTDNWSPLYLFCLSYLCSSLLFPSPACLSRALLIPSLHMVQGLWICRTTRGLLGLQID